MVAYFIDYDSPLGAIRLVATSKGLSGCYFHGQKYFPDGTIKPRTKDKECQVLGAAKNILEQYFDGKGLSHDLPLDLMGSDFQKIVWEALMAIPYGTVTTYSDIATLLGRSNSTRAVAAAIGRNPISVIVPCHRVIGKNGALRGYAGGLERKQWLLDLERRTS